MSDATIGMIGLGNMGGRMATRLKEAGFRVVGHDVDPARSGELGLEAAGSVADVGAACAIVMLSLPDSSVVEPVARGADGLLANVRPGQVVVDLSTSDPTSTIAIQADFADAGADFVDAGISGGALAAEKGTLTVMVGASSAAVVDTVRPALEAFATEIVVMGGPGSGHTTKILNNFLNAVSLSATAEVMLAAKMAGLDLRAVLRVLNSSSGVNFATLNRFPRIIEGDYLEGGLTGALMMKDVVLYAEYLRAIGAPSFNAAGPLASFGLANHLGYANTISNRVVDALGDLAGGVRLHAAENGGD